VASLIVGFCVRRARPELVRRRLVSRRTRGVGKVRQQELEGDTGDATNRTAGDEARGQIAEGHVRIGLNIWNRRFIDFLFELSLRCFRPACDWKSQWNTDGEIPSE